LLPVSSQAIITASHCVQDKKGRRIQERNSYFILGGYNLDYHEESQQQIGVNYFLTHPDWDPLSDKYDADIAIAYLSRKVKYNEYIVPICLPNYLQNSYDIIGRNGSVAGWGKTGDHQIFSYPYNSELKTKIGFF
jgi:hypothetical protein